MHIGEPAPVLAVTQVGGGSIDLAQLRGRPVWVVFLNTTCARCSEELTLMNDFLARYSSAGLVILAIDVKESEGTVATFAKRVSATFPFGLDLDGSAQTLWEVLSLPVHFWVDKDGIIRDAVPGVAGSAGMVHGLQQILTGVTVTP
jgi:peroxiredoxin